MNANLARQIYAQLRELALLLIGGDDEDRSHLGKTPQDDILQRMFAINLRLLSLDRDASAKGDANHNDFAVIQLKLKELSASLGSMAQGQKRAHEP